MVFVFSPSAMSSSTCGWSLRACGLGSRLLHELEVVAQRHRLTWLRLDTRSDLVEARRLYARHGYQEVAPINDEPYTEHWLAKSMDDASR
jgi:hypothetical protein